MYPDFGFFLDGWIRHQLELVSRVDALEQLIASPEHDAVDGHPERVGPPIGEWRQVLGQTRSPPFCGSTHILPPTPAIQPEAAPGAPRRTVLLPAK